MDDQRNSTKELEPEAELSAQPNHVRAVCVPNRATGLVRDSVSAYVRGTRGGPIRLYNVLALPQKHMLQLLCQLFSPFGVMKDVNKGTFEERAAAYRYNRGRRGHLSACMARWALSCGIAIVLMSFFDALGSSDSGTLSIFVLLAATCGTFVACSLCVLLVTAYVYVYLAHNDS